MKFYWRPKRANCQPPASSCYHHYCSPSLCLSNVLVDAMAPRSFPRWKGLRSDRGPKDSEELKRKQDGDLKDGTVNSSTLNSLVWSERCEDHSRTAVASHNLSKDGGSDTAQSLWDCAYGTLKTKNPRLVKKYEKLLSRELPKAGADQS
jgi:hypothetical protein